MKKEKNYERLGLSIIAAAILAVGSIAIIGAEPRASAHTDQPLALAKRACVIYQAHPAIFDCSLAIGSSTFKMI